MIYSLRQLKELDDLRLSSLASYLLDPYEEVEELKKGRINDRYQSRKRISQLEELVAELEAKVESQTSEKK